MWCFNREIFVHSHETKIFLQSQICMEIERREGQVERIQPLGICKGSRLGVLDLGPSHSNFVTPSLCAFNKNNVCKNSIRFFLYVRFSQ